MKYLSLFSGIEAATQAWHPLGWEPVAFSEIENFPNAVLEHHYPDVPNLGDVTKITENKIKKLGQIDLVVFGSPCQDLSVAGKRKGLDGERSGLFTNAIKIIKWARKHCGCRYALWENVPGAFSSNGGKDFGEVIKLLSGSEFRQEKYQTAGVVIGKEGLVEWRTLDAQHFGVPQRRRRIFALADFGDWESRGPVLFERESLFGHSSESGEKREETPTDVRGCFDKQRTGVYGDGNVASTMSARDYKDATDLVVEQPNLSAPLSARDYKGPGTDGIGETSKTAQGPGWNEDVSFTLNSVDKHAVAFTQNDGGRDATENTAPTLRSGGDGGIPQSAVAYSVMPMNSGKDYKARETDVAQPITAGGPVGGNQGGDYIVDQPQTAVAYSLGGQHPNAAVGVDVAPTLASAAGEGGGHTPLVTAPTSAMQVRRLTPKECERLQGFPDDYTKIPYRKKSADDCPDGPRYKALGNSMAVPVMRWIGERINQAD